MEVRKDSMLVAAGSLTRLGTQKGEIVKACLQKAWEYGVSF